MNLIVMQILTIRGGSSISLLTIITMFTNLSGCDDG